MQPSADACTSPTCLLAVTVSLWLLLFLLPAPVGCAPAPQAVIFGAVVDQASGEALRKVRIAVRETGQQAVTDDDGRFRLEGVPAGKHTLLVSTVGYRLLKKEVVLAETDSQEIIFYLGQEATSIRETVQVTAPLFEEVEKAATSQVTLNSSELKNLAGVLIDDPLRSVQTLPGVAAGDDFQSCYSVRGGGFRNNGIVVDGALTHNLVHTVQGTDEPTGSISLINGDMVESMALYTGAVSAKYGDRTASFLDIATREGSRDQTHVRLAVSGSNASVIAEGPLDARQRGSWIASARKSYADYLVHWIRKDSDLNMGFGDAQAKIAYDLSERSRLGATLLYGRAGIHRYPEKSGVMSLITASNDVGVAALSWAYTPDSRSLLETRLYLIREHFANRNGDEEILARGDYSELAVRSDFSYQFGRRHRLEAGAVFRFVDDRMVERRYNYTSQQFLDWDRINGRFFHNAVFVQDRWSLRPGSLWLMAGVRAERTGLTGRHAVNPRVAVEWRLGEGQKVDAGWGIASQFPEALAVLGRNGDPNLRAEVARQYVLAYERALGSKSRLRVEGYFKQESNLTRSDYLFRLVDGKVRPPDANFRYANALRGDTRGVEVFVQRRSANRLSGWISYAYSRSRRTDLISGETYSSDFDQRHTLNLYGSYRFSETWNFSLKARYGSGFPYPGYLEARGADFYLTAGRNEERLPDYGRLDLRINKAFFFKRRKLTLYLEVLNVSNRENIRYEETVSVNSKTRRAAVSTSPLLPILPTAGFVIEF